MKKKMNDIKHYDIYITGKVQGVFFRKHTTEKAKKEGINGFVKNMPDGSVYIEAEAPESTLNELVDWCKTGSPDANVENVEYHKSEIKGFDNFQVRY